MADDSPPRVFANRMIQQIIDHLTGGNLVIRPQDFLAIRLVFRQRGGQWEAVEAGDTAHLGILKDIVTTWAKDSERRTKEDEYV